MVLLGNFREIEQMHRCYLNVGLICSTLYIFCVSFRFVSFRCFTICAYTRKHTHTIRTHTPIVQKHLDLIAEICMSVLTSFSQIFFFQFGFHSVNGINGIVLQHFFLSLFFFYLLSSLYLRFMSAACCICV